MYAVGDTQWLMYPVGDGGGEEDLCHVRSGGHSVADVPSGGMGEERRISAMYAVGDPQWLMYQWGMGEERRISAMYAVGDTH